MRLLSAGWRSPIDLRQYCRIDRVSDVLQDANAQNISMDLQRTWQSFSAYRVDPLNWPKQHWAEAIKTKKVEERIVSQVTFDRL